LIANRPVNLPIDACPVNPPPLGSRHEAGGSPPVTDLLVLSTLLKQLLLSCAAM